MTDLYLKRLLPEDPTAWGYWPIFESRVRAALATLEPEAPPENVIQHYRALWGTQPARLGAWMILRPVERTNGHTPLPQVVGHVAGYVDAYWGVPCLMIHQVEATPWAGAPALRSALMRELDGWKGGLAARYGIEVNLVRAYVMHPDVAVRWFGEVVEVQRGGTLVSFRLSEVAVPSVEG